MIQTILNYTLVQAAPAENGRFPKTVAARTRRIYDALAAVYPVSTMLFHSRAHASAVEAAGIRDGMRVLEVATGSGEMFRRLVGVNRNGMTLGLDLSPKMAARTHQKVRRVFPEVRTQCHAVDARYLPFRDRSFDTVVCCYLLELLSADDILLALSEFHRVLDWHGTLTLVCIGENGEFFNRLYRLGSSLMPAFLGRQVEGRVTELVQASDFRLVGDFPIRQNGYPSRVITARK